MTNFEKIKRMSEGEYVIFLVKKVFNEDDAGITDIEKVREMSIEDYTNALRRYSDTASICQYCPRFDTNRCEHYCDNKSDGEIIYDWLNREVKE
ncbi:MAG: hypothetical protein ACI4KR_09230 [Ruminiclostridium sp.]